MKTYAMAVAIASSLLLVTAAAGTARADASTAGAMALEQRIQRLEDREAIAELLVTYGRLLDKKDLVGYSKLFARNGVWEGGIGVAKGPAGIQEMLEKVFSRVPAGRYGSDFHIMSGFHIDVKGNTATSWSRWTWMIEGDEGTPVAQRSGHYEDTLVKEDGQWKFQHRLTVTELPTPENDVEAEIYRKDYRDEN